MDIEKILSQMTLEEKAAFCSGKDFMLTKAIERLGVPSVHLSDGPHGLRKQSPGAGDHLGVGKSIEAVCFPAGCALASSFDTALAEKVGKTIGNECHAENVALILGPAINIKRSPLCGRNFEYYSEDPYLSGKLGAATVKGIQSQGAAACVKHFAANNQETLRFSSDSVMDERTLNEIYLSAFETVVKEAKPASVMSAYNKINGTFCSENKELLTEILRDKWGFDGFVVSDWGAVKDAAKGVKAGQDLIMPGGNEAFAKRIIDAVKFGELNMEELDTAVRNNLKFVKRYLDNKNKDAKFDRGADYMVAVEAAKECAVLLKNDNSVLPLNKDAKVAFIGDFAKSPRYQGGGSSHINSAKTVSALSAAEGLNVSFVRGYDLESSENSETLVTQAVQNAKESNVAVIFAGLPDDFETEGIDRDSLDLPADQNALIAAVAAVQPKTIVVLHNGAPVAMPWLDSVSAVLEMYLAGDGAGEAAVSLLFGDANPSGKLAETFPKKLSDTPCYLSFPGESGRTEYNEGIFVGYRYYDKREAEVLFPFGHGLSYTTFKYSDLKFDKTQMKGDEILNVSFTVTNTGKTFGKEVAQVYVGDEKSTVARPIRELKGFVKVALNPGESKTVSVQLNKRAFAYYSVFMKDYVIESGDFIIEVGSSSRDIRLSGRVLVNSVDVIKRVFTRNSTMGEIMSDPKGRIIMEKMQQGMKRGMDKDTEKSLGGGASKMVQRMQEEMPLIYLVGIAGVSYEMIDGLIAALNQAV